MEMTTEEIIRLLNADKPKSIYGYMYGNPFILTYGKHGPRYDRDKIIKIKKSDLQIGNDRIIFQWGWPGPDCTVYNIDDYGVTWAFSKREIKKPKEYPMVKK